MGVILISCASVSIVHPPYSKFKQMKDQKAIVIKCIKNDYPAFVIAGTDPCAVETMNHYLDVAKEKGCSETFLLDMKQVIEEMALFQKEQPEAIKIPD